MWLGESKPKVSWAPRIAAWLHAALRSTTGVTTGTTESGLDILHDSHLVVTAHWLNTDAVWLKDILIVRLAIVIPFHMYVRIYIYIHIYICIYIYTYICVCVSYMSFSFSIVGFSKSHLSGL